MKRRTLILCVVLTALIGALASCSFYKGIDSGTRTYGTTNNPYKY